MQRGFTMVEMLVTIMIVAILAALAAPTFTPIIQRWQIRSATESLQSSLYLAKSEAIKRGGNVSIAQIAADGECDKEDDEEDWSCGWSVFVDTNQNGAMDAGQTPPEELLQTVVTSPNVNILLPSSNGFLTIDRWGVMRSDQSTVLAFEIQAKKALSQENQRLLCIASGGRMTQVTGANASC